MRGCQGRSKSDYVARNHSRGAPQYPPWFGEPLGKGSGPYEEFTLGGKTYYVSSGGFLHRKDPPGSDEGEGYFSGYLDDEF